MFDKLV